MLASCKWRKQSQSNPPSQPPLPTFYTAMYAAVAINVLFAYF